MVLEIRRFGAPELSDPAPKCTYFSYSAAASGSDRVSSVNDGAVDDAKAKSLFKAVYLDRKDELVSQTKRLAAAAVSASLDRATVVRLLHMCCGFDAPNCLAAIFGGELGAVPLINEMNDTGRSPLHTAAKAHATRCVEALLKRNARTDLRSKDCQAQLALELSLSCYRMSVTWNPDDNSIEDLVVLLSDKDLSTVKLLCENTKETAEVAYAYAVEGRIVPLTALLIVAADELSAAVLEVRAPDSGSKEKATIYEWLIREALSLGRATTPSTAAKRAAAAAASTDSENLEKRKLLLREIELFQLFGAVSQSGGADKKVTSPLIRAAQMGDEAIIKLLLKANLDVNGADAEGNSALHWILKLSRLLCPHQIKIVLLLLEHGARVNQKNKLGVNAFHIAAGNGNAEALEVLLLEDPDGVQYKTEMKETPLFFAVKNEHMDCAELLLTWGANTEVLNLRRQRAIDLATSQDMRYILLNPTTISLVNHTFPNQHKCTPSGMTDEENITERNVISSTKTEVCKYFDSHRGCVRGAKCFYTHCEENSRRLKEGVRQCRSFDARHYKRKIFVGGLPSSVDSDFLGKFFEEQFGSVVEAIVIYSQTESRIQSRGFGYVIFKEEKSVSAAVEAHYVNMRGKQVEIKSLIPKLVLAAEFGKMSPQQKEDEQSCVYQLPQQKSNEKIMEVDNPEQGSWANRLVLGVPDTRSIEPLADITKSPEDPSMPKWLKVFKKWFPGFLKGLSKAPKNGSYALSCLKTDFKAKFDLELDHASLGYSKLSDFIKTFSSLCTVKSLFKGGCPNHMILLPNIARPQCQPHHTVSTSHTLPFSALIKNGGDSQDLSLEDAGDSKYLQDFSVGGSSDTMCLELLSDVSNVDSKCHQDLSIDGGSDANCLQVVSDDNGDSKYPQALAMDNGGDIQDLSNCQAAETFGSKVTSYGAEKPSHSYPGEDSDYNTSHSVHPRFLQFLKPDPLLYGRKELDELTGEANNENGQCGVGTNGGTSTRNPNRHLVLEALAKKWSKSYDSYFLREFDFPEKYGECLLKRMCLACNQRKMIWMNLPCRHLLWCSDCKMRAIGAAGLFPHKCVLCDAQVQKMDLLLPLY